MRVTEQVLVVEDYGGEQEEVLACCDDVEEARQFGSTFNCGTLTLCRVRIVEVLEVLE